MKNESMFQKLESRRLLSAAVHAHTLLIRGTSAADTIDVALNADNVHIDVTINGTAKSFTASKVKFIDIKTAAGDDTITLGAGLNRHTWINSGVGNDTINSGTESDIIDAGAGDDVVNDAGGNNAIWLGAGADSVISGNGRDLIYGGAGNDTIISNDGKDVIYGNDGDDSIDGGAGNDTVFGGKGNDTIYGMDGNDRLWGQGGDDDIEGGSGNDVLGGIVGTTNTLLGGDGKDTFFVKTSISSQTSDYDASAGDIIKATQAGDDMGS